MSFRGNEQHPSLPSPFGREAGRARSATEARLHLEDKR